MLAASQALAALAVLSVGVIYGTDIFSAVVLRPAMAALSDRELTQAAGRIHQYGDQRLPFPGIALIALLGWLGLYLRIAAPINRRMTKAARDQQTPADIRAMQARWDSIITTRAALQGSAMALLIANLVSS
jgi:hypothetical protein